MTWIVVLLFMFGPRKIQCSRFSGRCQNPSSSSFYFLEPVGWMSWGIGSYVFSTKQCGAVRYLRIRQFSQIGIASDFEFWGAHRVEKKLAKVWETLGQAWRYDVITSPLQKFCLVLQKYPANQPKDWWYKNSSNKNISQFTYIYIWSLKKNS